MRAAHKQSLAPTRYCMTRSQCKNAMNKYSPTYIFALCLVFVPIAAHADIGVPLVALFLPPMWLSLIPVILVEAFLLGRLLSLRTASTFLPATVSNIVTTILGVPFTWLLLAVAEGICCGRALGLNTFGAKVYAVTVQAPWLIPYESELNWMIPIALIVMALPCYAVSVAIEGMIYRKFYPELEIRKVWRATWISNAASYVMLGLLMWPAWKLADPLQSFFYPIIRSLMATVFIVASTIIGKT